MSLATLAVSYGATPTAITFENRHELPDLTQAWTLDSPQGDIEGQWTVALGTKTTKNKIEMTGQTVNIPVYDADSGEYLDYIKVNISLNRPRSISKALASDALDIACRLAMFGGATHDAIVDARPFAT